MLGQMRTAEDSVCLNRRPVRGINTGRAGRGICVVVGGYIEVGIQRPRGASSRESAAWRGIQVCATVICLDKRRFEDRVIPLSRTRLPVPSQWFD